MKLFDPLNITVLESDDGFIEKPLYSEIPSYKNCFIEKIPSFENPFLEKTFIEKAKIPSLKIPSLIKIPSLPSSKLIG